MSKKRFFAKKELHIFLAHTAYVVYVAWWSVKVEDQMKLLENCWSELLLLDVLYKQLDHSDTQQLLMVLQFHFTCFLL